MNPLNLITHPLAILGAGVLLGLGHFPSENSSTQCGVTEYALETPKHTKPATAAPFDYPLTPEMEQEIERFIQENHHLNQEGETQ